MTPEYDLIVVGGGIFGLSVAREAARRRRRVVVVERGPIPNPVAASYGPSRKIRSTYLDPHYARLALEAMAAWREVEAELGGTELFAQCGNLAYSAHEQQPRLDELEAVLRSVGAGYRSLDQAEMRREFPQFRRARRGLLETTAGFLKATACVEAIAELARRSGATIIAGREVEAVEPAGAALLVRAGELRLSAPQVVVAGGGWSVRLLPELSEALWQCQQGILYVHDAPAHFQRPAFVPFSGSDGGFYGFPAEPGLPLKVALHVLGAPLDDPDFDRQTLPPGFESEAASWLRDELGLDITELRVSFDSCMYNLSRSNDFLLDFHPRLPSLFVATAGSGHGFKFGSMLGKVVLDRLDGQASDRWYERFSYQSFLNAPAAARPL
jgi:sarcosine oxidase